MPKRVAHGQLLRVQFTLRDEEAAALVEYAAETKRTVAGAARFLALKGLDHAEGKNQEGS